MLKRLRQKMSKHDSPTWMLSCRCCDGFDFREYLLEKAAVKEAEEEIAELVQRPE